MYKSTAVMALFLTRLLSCYLQHLRRALSQNSRSIDICNTKKLLLDSTISDTYTGMSSRQQQLQTRDDEGPVVAAANHGCNAATIAATREQNKLNLFVLMNLVHG